jgi:hypothetical protein
LATDYQLSRTASSVPGNCNLFMVSCWVMMMTIPAETSTRCLCHWGAIPVTCLWFDNAGLARKSDQTLLSRSVLSVVLIHSNLLSCLEVIEYTPQGLRHFGEGRVSVMATRRPPCACLPCGCADKWTVALALNVTLDLFSFGSAWMRRQRMQSFRASRNEASGGPRRPRCIEAQARRVRGEPVKLVAPSAAPQLGSIDSATLSLLWL